MRAAYKEQKRKTSVMESNDYIRTSSKKFGVNENKI